MVLKLYDTDLAEMIMEKEYPAVFSVQDGGIRESEVQLDLPAGRGYYKEIYFEHVHIGYGSAALAREVRLDFESDFETVEMHFSLKGGSSARTGHFSGEVDFSGNQHNIIYANRLKGEMRWHPTDFQLLEINLSPRFFTRFLPEGSHLSDRFRETIEKGRSGLLSATHRLISLRMYELIREIMHCNRKGIFKRMFLEARVIELLLLQLEQMDEAPHPAVSLRKPDIDKLYAVRDYLLAHLDTTCSLTDLAHRVGTNEFALKKGFRELFGTTVFGFWHDAKMEQARKLLAEEDRSVSEVSDLVGYQNPRHFSSAFRKKFGVLPSRMRLG
ncbi:MAG: AraC family transcriptional regulator [Cytophagaceae bacterium SCN 52-12]|nr:MAG: AraC family transcriptional regulator [Cytophagaceae bacterium SCN 52-12]